MRMHAHGWRLCSRCRSASGRPLPATAGDGAPDTASPERRADIPGPARSRRQGSKPEKGSGQKDGAGRTGRFYGRWAACMPQCGNRGRTGPGRLRIGCERINLPSVPSKCPPGRITRHGRQDISLLNAGGPAKHRRPRPCKPAGSRKPPFRRPVPAQASIFPARPASSCGRDG